MIDYYAFWHGLLFYFVALPAVVGAIAGAIYGWRKGWRGLKLVAAAVLCGIALSICTFVGVIVFLRA